MKIKYYTKRKIIPGSLVVVELSLSESDELCNSRPANKKQKLIKYIKEVTDMIYI